MNARGQTDPPPGIPGVTLRTEPDLKSPAAGRVPRDTELEIVGVTNDGRFYRVRYQPALGDKEAWIHRDVLRVPNVAPTGAWNKGTCEARQCDVIYGGTDCVMFCDTDAECTKCGYGLGRCGLDPELHPTRKTCGVKP